MAKQIERKINQLERLLPERLLVDAAWMEDHGCSRSLRKQYVDHGWLEQPARGVYRRQRGELGWEQVVISLQALLHRPVSIGGRTALELQGYAGHLSKGPRVISLYADSKLPGWLQKLPGWQVCRGISGSIPVEWVAGLVWNRWQALSGIRRQTPQNCLPSNGGS